MPNEYDQLIQDNLNPPKDEGSAYDDMVKGAATARTENATLNLYNAKDANPDTVAKSIDLAKDTGLPQDTVERNYDDVLLKTIGDKNNAAINNSPTLQKWLSNVENAKISKDDIPVLDTIQNELKKAFRGDNTPWEDMTEQERADVINSVVGNSDPLDHLRSAGSELIRTVFGGLLTGGGELIESGGRQLEQAVTGKITTPAKPGTFDYYLAPANWLKEAGAGAKYLADVIDIPEERKTFGTRTIGSAGQIVGQVAISAVQPEIGLMTLFGMGADQMASNPDIADDPLAERDLKIILGALGTGVSEKIQLEFLTRKLPPEARHKVLAFLKDKALSGGGEAVQEVVEGMWHSLVAAVGHDPDGELFDWGALWDSASLAFSGAATFRTLFEVMLPGRARGGNVAAAEAKVEKYKKMKDLVLESQVYQRHKGKFEEFADTALADETDPNIYLDASEVQTFFQSREESPQEVMQQLGVSPESFAQAVSSGGDIRVPLSKYLTLADTEYYDPLLQDMRINQGDETLREATEASQSKAQAIFAEAEQIKAESKNQAELTAQGQEVRDFVRDQLVATGKFDTDTSNKYAALWEAFAVTLGHRQNVTPMEALKQAAGGVKIQAGLTPAAQNAEYISKIRKFKVPAAKRVYGDSLMQYLAGKGGVIDEGGELSARDAQDFNKGKPGQKRFVTEDGLTIDGALEAAVQAGYIEGDIGQLTEQDLYDAIDRELSGEPVYAPGNVNQDLADEITNIEQARDELGRQGIDINKATDEEIVAALFGDTAEPGVVLNQSINATLYHGTTKANAERIKKDGVINGPVYLSASYKQAEEYALNNDKNGVVITINYTGELLPDNESKAFKSAEEAISSNSEVYTNEDIHINAVSAKFSQYSDYELVSTNKYTTLNGIEVGEITDEEYQKHFTPSDKQTNSQSETDFRTVEGRQVRSGFLSETQARTTEGRLLKLHRGASVALHQDHFSRESLGKNTNYAASGLGVWFSTDPEVASNYGVVEQFNLDIRNPKHYTTETFPELETLDEYHNHREALRTEGYDGIVIDHGEIGGGVDYIAFSPEQVIKPPTETYFQQKEQANRNHIGLWSAVEQSVIDMPLPAWKAKPKKVLTEEEQTRLDELTSRTPVVRPVEEREELKSLLAKHEKELASANGNDIWAKLKSTPGIKKEELTWLGIEDYLKSKKKFTRDEVVSFVRDNGVNVEETLAEGDTKSDEGEFDWTEEIDDDSENWEGRAEDYLYEFDNESDPDFYFFDKSDWIDNHLQQLKDNFEPSMPADDFAELNALEDTSEVLDFIDSHGYDAQETADSLMRDDFEEEANKAAEEEYMDNPYIAYTDSVTGYKIYGNDDVGYVLDTGQGYRNGAARSFSDAFSGPVYSFNEAEIRAREIAYNQGEFVYEDDPNTPKWSEYVMEGDYGNYRELKLTLPDIEGKGSEDSFYYDVHFPDRNIVAFLRVEDRVLKTSPDSGADYESAYHIDEFQSDWHQQGRQVGYQLGEQDPGVLDEQAQAVEDKLDTYVANIFAGLDKTKIEPKEGSLEDVKPAFTKYNVEYAEGKSVELTAFNFKEYILRDDLPLSSIIKENFVSEEQKTEINKLVKEKNNLLARAHAEREGVVDAPFKGDGWLALGLKRALVDAVEQGNTALTWSDSEVLADRWSEKYRQLYQTQYDKKMSSIIKKLTKQTPVHLNLDGEPHEHQELGYWAIPITPELSEQIKRDGFALFQKKTDINKGQIQFPGTNEEAVITLFESADLSTFLHESGHFFLQAYRNLAAENPEIQKDLDTLTQWMGVTDASQIGIEQHEQFARGFEAYLFEGKAPSVELQSVFNRFKSWLIQVYKSVSRLNVTLNDEVRGVMDRMLATEEAIHEAERIASLLPLYNSAKAAGMTEQEYEDYKRSYERATNAAQTDVDSELLKRLKREQTDAWKLERNALRDQVLEELYSLPSNQARWFFMRGTLPNGELPPGIEPVKLSRAALIEMYGDGLDALWRELPFGKYSVWTKGDDGVHPDEIASVFGFANGDEMVRAMVSTKGNLNKIATEEADLMMRKQYGDPDSDRAIAELALETIQNQERSNFLSVELRALEKRTGAPRTPRNVIKRAAERIINETRIADIKEHTYLRAANKWARKSVEFVTAKKFEEAADAKRKQLLNQAIYQQAIKARKYVDTKVNYLKKFDKPGTRKNLARDYLDQIDSILEAYDFKKTLSLKDIERRKSFSEWLASQVEQGLEVIVPSSIIEDARKRSYKDLPYEEFIGLVDSVKNVEHLARFKQQMLVNQEKRNFEDLVDDLVTVALDTNKISPQKIGLQTNLDRAKHYSREVFASHVKMEFLLQQLDGNKPNGLWWNAIFRPIAEAEDNEIVMNQAYMTALNEILKGYGNKGRAGLYKQNVPGSEAVIGRNIKRAEMISIALNWGNDGNKKALLRGEDWSEQQVQQLLDDNMTEQDWNVVQSIWNLIDDLWPDISKLQKELTGVVPAKVEATKVNTKFGQFEGGYYPLVYDVSRSEKAFKYEENMTVSEMFGGNFTMPSTRKGHTIERVGSAGMPVKLDMDVIATHLTNVIHDLTHRKAILQADHILQNKQIKDVIVGATNLELYRHIRPWLAGIASDRRPFSGWHEQAVGRLRRGATAVNMGWKFTTAIVQPLGYLQSIDLLGEKYALKGLARFYGNPIKAKKVIDEVFSKSVMMRNRSKTFDRDVRDAIRKIRGDSLTDKIQRSLFSHIGFMDYSVSIPTWIGAYEKSMDAQKAEGKLNEATAIAYADSIVRMSQSAGGAKDLAAIQRGSEYQRAFTMFYSYFSVLHNLIRRRAQQTKAAGVTPANITRTTMSMLYLVILPAVLSELIIGRGPDDDDDEEFLTWAATTSAAYPFMTMVGFRDFANALATGYSFQATPVLDAADSMFASGKSVGDAFTDFSGLTEDEFDRKDVKNLAMTSGYLFGLPSRQLYISSEHLYSVLNDEEEFSLYEFLYRNKKD